MPKASDKLRQIRLEHDTDNELSKLRDDMPVRSTRGSLANACLILGIALMRKNTIKSNERKSKH